MLGRREAQKLGSIRTDSLVISKGGFFNGNVAKINDEPAAGHGGVYHLEDMRAAGHIVPR